VPVAGSSHSRIAASRSSSWNSRIRHGVIGPVWQAGAARALPTGRSRRQRRPVHDPLHRLRGAGRVWAAGSGLWARCRPRLCPVLGAEPPGPGRLACPMA
jgi:hypothetical protein